MPLPLNVNPLNPSAPDQNPDLTSTAQAVVAEQNIPTPKPELDPKIKKRNDEFRQRVEVTKLYRRKLISNWTVSIDYRRGKPFSSQTDEDQVAVNLDWYLTKNKQASLFSQVPKVRINHGSDTTPKMAPWAVPFEKRLNDELVKAGIESAMDECLPDCINAAGFGAIIVSYEAIMEDKQVPAKDPSTLPPGSVPEMITVPTAIDHRYMISRISPSDLLWPINFSGADFDNAPWMGRSGRITWSEAVQRFKLNEDDKATILGEDRPMMDKLTHDVERDKVAADDMVSFDEIFYKEFQYDPDSKSYETIHHLIFLSGKDEPVLDEPWKGQQVGGPAVLGAFSFPIRVLTLTYITDETIPPSDSAIGRPQVNEINKARTQMIRQRERSLPVRWFDVNRVDPAIQQGLMRGQWQAMIPVQGEGSRVIGEVARATMPVENFKFDQIAKEDLGKEWTQGPNQEGSGQGVETKAEAEILKEGANVPRIRERAKVAAFFVSIAEVLGGLMCLFEEASVFGEGFDPSISRLLKYSILADSTVLIDSAQKLSRLNSFVNTYAKSGWINLEPVLQEIAQLSGLDPTIVIKAPEPKPPVEPNISLRLTGVEDMLNPLALAFLIKSGQAPAADLIEQAKTLIQQAVTPPAGMNIPGAPEPAGALPMLNNVPTPNGEGNSPTPPLPSPMPGPPPGSPLPPTPTIRPGEANPKMTILPTLNKRSE